LSSRDLPFQFHPEQPQTAKRILDGAFRTTEAFQFCLVLV
jgi:hypothetical protein